MNEREALRELGIAIDAALKTEPMLRCRGENHRSLSLLYALMCHSDGDVPKATNDLIDALNTVKMTEPMCDYWDEMMATPEGKRLEAAMVAVTQGGGDDKKVTRRIEVRRSRQPESLGTFDFPVRIDVFGQMPDGGGNMASPHVRRPTDKFRYVTIGDRDYFLSKDNIVTIGHDNPWNPQTREDQLIEALRQIAMNAADGGSFDVIHKIADDAIGGE